MPPPVSLPRSRGRVRVGAEPGKDASGEGGGERAILLVAAHPDELVHGAACEPAARQCPVDRGDAERQHPMHRRCWPLDAPDPFTKGREKIARHASDNRMLPFCSDLGGLSIPSRSAKRRRLLNPCRRGQHAPPDRLVLRTLIPVAYNVPLAVTRHGFPWPTEHLTAIVRLDEAGQYALATFSGKFAALSSADSKGSGRHPCGSWSSARARSADITAACC